MILAIVLFRALVVPLARSQDRRVQLRAANLERLRRGLEARDRERARWARGLQDDTATAVRAVCGRLRDAVEHDENEALRAVVTGTVEELSVEIDGLRQLIAELRPPGLAEYGLAGALSDLARTARARDGLTIEVSVDPSLPRTLPTLPNERSTASSRPPRERSRNATPEHASILPSNKVLTGSWFPSTATGAQESMHGSPLPTSPDPWPISTSWPIPSAPGCGPTPATGSH